MAFSLPDYIFPYYPSLCHMERWCKIAIIFPVTVSIRSRNKFFKTRLTANSFFLFLALAAVCLQFVSQLFRNLQNNRGDKDPILYPNVRFPVSRM